MAAAANMVEIAALVGDTARATMLAALMGGQALTSSELAAIAHISRPTASGHLGKLASARLLTVTSKRRNRYYRIASPLVAKMLESIKAVAAIEVAAAASAAFGARRRAALRPHLLRPSGGTARRRHRRRADRQDATWC